MFCDFDSKITIPTPDVHTLKEQTWELVKNDVSEISDEDWKKIFHIIEIKSDRFLAIISKEIDAATGWYETEERLYCCDNHTGKKYHFRKKIGEDVYMDNFPENGLLEWTRQMRDWAKEKSRQVK